jgi:hypothetical protein
VLGEGFSSKGNAKRAPIAEGELGDDTEQEPDDEAVNAA